MRIRASAKRAPLSKQRESCTPARECPIYSRGSIALALLSCARAHRGGRNDGARTLDAILVCPHVGGFVMNVQTLILEMAPPHVAQARVPVLGQGSSPLEVAHDYGGRMLVWDGASDATVFECARVNHAFRAWHDAAHIAGNFGFTLEEERATCELQIAQALARYPLLPRGIIMLIRADVIGQAEYFASVGAFPRDQKQFVRDYVSG